MRGFSQLYDALLDGLFGPGTAEQVREHRKAQHAQAARLARAEAVLLAAWAVLLTLALLAGVVAAWRAAL